MTVRRIGAAHANHRVPRVNVNRPTNTCSPLGKLILRTAVEAGVVGLGGLAAATMGTTALLATIAGNAAGAGKGAALSTQKNLVFPLDATKGLILGPGVLWFSIDQAKEIPTPSLVHGVGSYLLSSGLVAGAINQEEIPQGMDEEQRKAFLTSRIFEWGTGAAVGTLVTGVATSAIGFGLGIAAGVVAMKATRFGVRALCKRFL